MTTIDASDPDLLAVLRGAARHYDCDDCWYSCAVLTCDEERRGPCDCGAALARKVLARIAPDVLAEIVAMDPEDDA